MLFPLGAAMCPWQERICKSLDLHATNCFLCAGLSSYWWKIVRFFLNLFRSSSRSRSFSRSVSPRTPQPRSPIRTTKPASYPRRNTESRRERERSDRARERERDRPRFVFSEFTKILLSCLERKSGKFSGDWNSFLAVKWSEMIRYLQRTTQVSKNLGPEFGRGLCHFSLMIASVKFCSAVRKVFNWSRFKRKPSKRNLRQGKS